MFAILSHIAKIVTQVVTYKPDFGSHLKLPMDMDFEGKILSNLQTNRFLGIKYKHLRCLLMPVDNAKINTFS